ncbi:MAG TPA: hypothetical protein VF492_02445 [Verrucomicrobiae bacterium]
MSQPKIDRRGWLSWFLQKRRRERAASLAILLTSDGHGRFSWTANGPAEFGFSIGFSADGVAWNDTFAVTGGQFYRDCSGTAGYFRVAQSAANGLVLPPYSNVVQSDGL